jgi:glycerophosphoryl diester phosphodiesterase
VVGDFERRVAVFGFHRPKIGQRQFGRNSRKCRKSHDAAPPLVSSTMLKIAHRGASAHAPENTLASFRLAVEMSAKFIETDLQLTRDAKIVAMHDATVDRTTNGRGRISKMSLVELRGLDAGVKFLSVDGKSYKGERVPTLDEILEFAKTADVTFYLELKETQGWGFEQSLVGSLRRADAINRVVIISFDAEVLSTVKRIAPELTTGFLCEKPTTQLIEKAVAIGAKQFLPRPDKITLEIIVAAHHAKLLVVAWTVNEIEDMRTVEAMGVDGIISDYPDRLNELPE